MQLQEDLCQSFVNLCFSQDKEEKKKKREPNPQPLYLCSQPSCLLLTHQLLHTRAEQVHAPLQHLSPPPAEHWGGEAAAHSPRSLRADNQAGEAGAVLPAATLRTQSLPQDLPPNASTGMYGPWQTNRIPTAKGIKPRGNGTPQAWQPVGKAQESSSSEVGRYVPQHLLVTVGGQSPLALVQR